ncbi:MAG: ATP-binding protein, partial [Pseudomonadota bacterium]
GGPLAVTVEPFSPLQDAAGLSLPRPVVVGGIALGFAAAAALIPVAFWQIVCGLVALILMTSAIWLRIMHRRLRHVDLDAVGWARALLDVDPVPGFLSTASGDVLHANPAAAGLFTSGSANGRRRKTVKMMLEDHIPDASQIIARLMSEVAQEGIAEDAVETPKGPVWICAKRDAANHIIWRFEQSGDLRARDDQGNPVGVLQLGPENAIRTMNTVARQMFGDTTALTDIFPSLPVQSGRLNTVSTRQGPTEVLAVNFVDTAEQSHLCVFPPEGCRDVTPDDWSFFDHLPVPLLKLSRDGQILLSNPLARDLLAQSSITGRSLSEMVEGLGRSIKDWLTEAAEARGGLHSEFLRIKRKDREVFVQVTLNRAVEEDGPVLIAVLNDATAHKSLEAQFVQSQKMQAIGQLAGGVAHDFNNLLTAITGHCDLLLLRHDQGDPDYADLIQINQNANRAAALVSQLLAYSRKQTLRPEVMDLRDMLSDLTHLLNRLVGEKVTLSLRHDPMLWSIRADKRQLEQVLMNLVVNARDAMREKGGDIRIETENTELHEPLRQDRAVVAPGRYVLVRVADEGHGIPTEHLQKVFEPFYTTKRTGEGTGLGLSTAYGIVKQTGGFIFVDSTPGKGATFRIYFPAHDQVAPARPTATAAPLLSAPSDGVVLLVEDEAPVRAFASRALQLRGLTVHEAASAEAALELLEDPELQIDVFVSDVVMPGIDGPSWVIEALDKRPETRVVFISGYAEETFGEIQSRIPNSVFLPKPFSLTELTETVQQQIAFGTPAAPVPAQ